MQVVVGVLRCIEDYLSHVKGMDARKDWEVMGGSRAKASTDDAEGRVVVHIYLLSVVALSPCGHYFSGECAVASVKVHKVVKTALQFWRAILWIRLTLAAVFHAT